MARTSVDRNCSRSTPRLCATVGLFALAISAWPAPATEDTHPDDQPSDLAGLRDKYFGWFESIRATQEGLAFRVGDRFQWMRVFHLDYTPLREKMPDSSTKFIGPLRPGDEVAVKLGSDIGFASIGEEALTFAPLPDDLQRWGFRVRFSTWSFSKDTYRVGDRVYPTQKKIGHSDYAIALLLRRRDQAVGDPTREILLMPDDIQEARRIVAGGGFVPEMAVAGDANAVVRADASTSRASEAGQPTAPEVAHEREGGETACGVRGMVVGGMLAVLAAGLAIWIWLAGRRAAGGRDR